MKNQVQMNEKKLIFGIPEYEFVLLLIVHICALFTFIGNSTVHTIVGIVAIGCTCLLAFNQYLYLLLPVYMIFYEQLVPFGGFVGYRIYTFVVIVSCIFTKNTKVSFKSILFFLFLMLYTFGIVYVKDKNATVMYVINFLFLALYSENYLKEGINYKQFFAFMALSAVLSAAYGLFGGNANVGNVMLIDGEYIEYTRFLATFNDPNYLGLIFNVIIFALLCIKYENKFLRIGAITVCYIALLATLSVTAIIVNLGFLAIYFVFVKKLNPVVLPIMLIIVVIIVNMYNYALSNDMGFITNFAYRIDAKIEALNEGDIDATTTDRTELSRNNLEKFSEKSIFGMLFGGSYITSTGKEKTIFKEVSHNEFVDNLLFFGIIGAILFWSYFIARFRKATMIVKNDTEIKKAVIFAKVIYIAYCFTLTIFPDIRLMFLFFI
ncbi:MAG: hypothetical protein J6C16_03185 [Clostridia bacterium]|nr:hypothetical protein [Clostridia bacterium]